MEGNVNQFIETTGDNDQEIASSSFTLAIQDMAICLHPMNPGRHKGIDPEASACFQVNYLKLQKWMKWMSSQFPRFKVQRITVCQNSFGIQFFPIFFGPLFGFNSLFTQGSHRRLPMGACLYSLLKLFELLITQASHLL